MTYPPLRLSVGMAGTAPDARPITTYKVAQPLKQPSGALTEAHPRASMIG
ncbi:MAG TPA: hypothetical protein VLU95_09150 [Candidatus Acidoferrum sp.]|nr:hypothetical protein [Candidatus Acidoferrum sp.]